MVDKWEEIPATDKPVLLNETKSILKYLKSLNNMQLQELWNCNDQIARQNVKRIEAMNLENHLTPALLAYDGIAFQYMAPIVFTEVCLEYVQEHLVILSAFYGALKPQDGVTPYRLEMQAKAKVNGAKDLYEFWGAKLYQQVQKDNSDRTIINLASKEYSKCVENYLQPQDKYITITFGEMAKDKFVTKGTYAKMARGEMVRFMAENKIETPEEIKTFNRLGFCFRNDLSTETEFVFERVSK